ncbi:MAG: DUF47 family protein [Spirochaetes bacterium]|jgi:hypothetical protein|nr:DUF47 family protein [Spirochaetota bacterium]
MGFSFLPKETKFFELFDSQAEKLTAAAKCFSRLAATNGFIEASVREMAGIEHECDDITHDIIDKLNRTFITPFDREDIHSLAHEMDDVVDLIYTIIKRMYLYKLDSNDDLIEFSKIIEESVENVVNVIKSLKDTKQFETLMNYCIEVNRLENAGDLMRDMTIVKLFDNTKDPVMIIKWKEVYQDAETVLDQCEDIVNIVESIIVKQG